MRFVASPFFRIWRFLLMGLFVALFLTHTQIPVFAFTPNDLDIPRQAYLSRVQAFSAWDMVVRHTQQHDVVIAVLDTGVAIDHPDLVNAIWRNTDEVAGDGVDNDDNSFIDDVQGWDFLESSPDPRPKITSGYSFDAVNHGTVVAGIIAAESNNTFGIAGASLRAKIMPLRVLDSKGSGNTLLLAQAIEYAVENGADIINLSLVGDVNDPQLARSIDAAYRAGIAIVAASGNQQNQGINLNVTPRYPVCETDTVNRIIGVAAIDESSKLASFSNYGSQCIDISAPGVNMYSTSFHSEVDPAFTSYYSGGWSGTSVAAPLVSSALALIKQVAPTMSIADMYRALLSSASSLEASNANYKDLGYGALDMAKALETAIGRSRQADRLLVLSPGKGFEPKVGIQNTTGVVVAEFMAYARSFRGGVQSAVGDVDNDGDSDIVVAPFSSGGSHIRIFDSQGVLRGQFMAYDPKVSGGFSVAIGDVTGDGAAEIITAPLQVAKMAPEVRVFTPRGVLLASFNAYTKSFTGGVKLATGDVDGDGVQEIITAPASRGGPHVRIFNGVGDLESQFMAFDSGYRGGLGISTGDVDLDGRVDIVTVQETDRNVQARIFSGRGEEKNRFPLYPEVTSTDQPSGITVGDYTGDGQPDIISYALLPGSPIKLFDYYGRVIDILDVVGNRKAIRYSFTLID